ncbi:MAG: hypothetical protein HC795_05835 [Coleofasciculaceae cyanobacterium RL_1_1]|nr:hypothetical protein [Coleofasciculaceae cyanobacterium RL_1_1]
MTRSRYCRYWWIFSLTGAIVYGVVSLLIGVDSSGGGLGWRVSIAPRRDVQQVRELLDRGHGVVGFDAFGYREPYQFWHNNDGIIEPLRAADVVFLGSSRAQFGYDQSLLISEFKRRNLKVYNLSFGCNENLGFGVELLERYQVKPAMLIINLDLNIFRRKFSHCTQDVVAGHGTIAFQRHRLAQTLQFSLLNSLNRLIAWATPRDFNHYLLPNYLLVRRKATGFWATELFETHAQLNNVTSIAMVDDPECRQSLNAEERKNIDYWRDRLARINPNVTLLFTYIPHDRFCPDRLQAIAKYLKQPGFQYSHPAQLQTFDTSHLTRDSASDYTLEFVKWLESIEYD